MDMAKAVMVRAFGGEPLKRVLVGAAGPIIYIANPDGRVGTDVAESIGFPAEDVFLFDAATFARLRRQYEGGQVPDWATARPTPASRG
jgi:hypothetical protein